MTSLRLATAFVRVWTRVYTSRTSPALREERRAEIESDLWELQHDLETGRGLAPSVQVIARLLLGVPDDLCWRLEHADEGDRRWLRRTVALTAAALALIAFWLLPARPRQDLSTDRTRVLECGSASAPPQTRAEFRMQVITCAGAFFTSRRNTDPGTAARDD
jgi:hypothetical protein